MLLGSTKIVIYLGLTKIVVGDCRQHQNTYFELAYDQDLALAFDKIIAKLPSTSYKIILGKDVSYTVKLEKLSEGDGRLQVKSELAKHIPESFVDNQFDWRIDQDQFIEAIVISGSTYHALQEIKTKHPNIRLETQSASSLLLEMGKSDDDSGFSPELFSFAAQKGREHGNDEVVLNVDVESVKNPVIRKPSRQSNLKYIFITFLIVLAIAGGWLWTSRAKPTPSTTVPSSSPSPSPSPTLAPVKVQSDYKVVVQNGTKKAGFANETKLKLEALGFTQVEARNAEADSLTTKVNVPEALPESIQTILIDCLKPLDPIITIEALETKLNLNDIVIILGSK